MIRMIVGRLHVGSTNREVVEYVVSCMRKDAWDNMTLARRFTIMREAIKVHRENRQLYQDVMSGRLG